MNPELDALLTSYMGSALTHMEKDEYDAAICDFTEIIKLMPDTVAAFLFRGDAYLKKGQFDEAISDLTEAIKRNQNNNAFAYRRRGLAYFHKGQYDNSISDCTEAIRLDPDNADAYGFRGQAYRQFGQKTRRFKILKKRSV